MMHEEKNEGIRVIKIRKRDKCCNYKKDTYQE